tara:strand:- start:192 stop:419 length:228 start_codon:yes stop_codon:yes gene_type:complete
MLRRETHLKLQRLYTVPDTALEVILALVFMSVVQSIIIILIVISILRDNSSDTDVVYSTVSHYDTHGYSMSIESI